LEPEHVASLVRLQVAANNDAEFRAKTWREKLKNDLFAKLSLREPPQAPALKPRNADDVRAAILGDIYTEELRQKDESASARRAVEPVSDKQRSLRIFYATTNTDAPLERDAVSARGIPPHSMECFPLPKLQRYHQQCHSLPQIICCVLPAVQATARRCGIEVSFIDVNPSLCLPHVSTPNCVGSSVQVQRNIPLHCNDSSRQNEM
jgi:hypothetical protein